MPGRFAQGGDPVNMFEQFRERCQQGTDQEKQQAVDQLLDAAFKLLKQLFKVSYVHNSFALLAGPPSPLSGEAHQLFHAYILLTFVDHSDDKCSWMPCSCKHLGSYSVSLLSDVHRTDILLEFTMNRLLFST